MFACLAAELNGWPRAGCFGGGEPPAPAAAGPAYRLPLFLGGSGAKLSRPLAVSRTSAPATLAP
jgi:hypothetical protein